MDRTLIEKLIEEHENRLAVVYPDTEGNMTVGVGFNLDRAGARESCAACGVDYDAVCAGEPLTDAQIDALFESDLSAAIYAAQCQVRNFDTLPDAVQAVVVDMVFNMGSAKFAGFVKFKAALAARDFDTAAKEIKDSRWCGQVGTRCAGNAQMLEAEARLHAVPEA